MTRRSVLCVVGARPNFMKMAPALRALESHPEISATLVHTGQHYDAGMSDDIIRQLGAREPDYRLEVGSATHAIQTARVMERLDPLIERLHPDIVLVSGDVNSTLAAALVAAKRHVPVAHIEAGLRSFDRRMPEEINRVLVDQISDILYTTEKSAESNLLREGIDRGKIAFVGNLMIDSLFDALPRAVPAMQQIERHFGRAVADEAASGYALLTLHRPSNVDGGEILAGILGAIARIAMDCPVIFPVHPRTRARMDALGLKPERVHCMPPVGYHEFVGLMREAKLVLTDSGGVQEETTALGVRCLTLRENTERPITVEEGSNQVVGCDPADIVRAAGLALATPEPGRIPQGWDGRAATRLAEHLVGWLAAS